MQIITLKLISYNGKKRIAVFFKYDQRLIDRIKNIPDRKWDAKNKCWHIPYRDNYLDYLNKEFKGEIKFIPCESLSIKNDHTMSETNNGNSVRIPKEYLETLKLKRYSKNTIKSYLNHFKHFLYYYHNIKPQEISEEQIRDFLLYIVDDKKVSNSYQNQAINSIKFYYEQVLGKPVKNYYLQRPKKEKKLPTVLSEEEVIKILSQIENLKHKCIIYLIYSAGLRRNELINLRITDINGSRKIILINGGKGKKDRITLLSDKVLELLRIYYKKYRPQQWLFEGQNGGQYSAESIQKIFKRAVRKAGIKKNVSIHVLRHSFATHLLERGTDIRYIQELLGHKSSKTTEIYTHITKKGMEKIKSPLDHLDL